MQFRRAQAEQAAAAGDQRTLYQIVKRLAPKSFQGASRLLGPEADFLARRKNLLPYSLTVRRPLHPYPMRSSYIPRSTACLSATRHWQRSLVN